MSNIMDPFIDHGKENLFSSLSDQCQFPESIFNDQLFLNSGSYQSNSEATEPIFPSTSDTSTTFTSTPTFSPANESNSFQNIVNEGLFSSATSDSSRISSNNNNVTQSFPYAQSLNIPSENVFSQSLGNQTFTNSGQSFPRTDQSFSVNPDQGFQSSELDENQMYFQLSMGIPLLEQSVGNTSTNAMNSTVETQKNESGIMLQPVSDHDKAGDMYLKNNLELSNELDRELGFNMGNQLLSSNSKALLTQMSQTPTTTTKDNISSSNSNQNLNESSVESTEHSNDSMSNLSNPPSLPANRDWTLVRYPHHQIDPNLRVEINISIRGEDASCFVPDRLYCSHRYRIEHKIISSTLPTKIPLLLSRMLVIDPESKQEIRSKKSKKEIIKGNPEAACILNETGFRCKTRIQFTESCYKHNRQDFQIVIHYCEPQNKEDPIFSLVSPSLKIFSRKPSIPVSTLTKAYKPTKKRKKKNNFEKRKKMCSDEDETSKLSMNVDSLDNEQSHSYDHHHNTETDDDLTNSDTQSSFKVDNEEVQYYNKARNSFSSQVSEKVSLLENFAKRVQSLSNLKLILSNEQNEMMKKHMLARLYQLYPEHLPSN